MASLMDRLRPGRSKKKGVKEGEVDEASLKKTLAGYPHLMAMRPKKGYVFRSDYFEVDGEFAVVLAFFYDPSASQTLSPFWGYNRIPDGLPDGVTTMLFQQVNRMSDKWVTSHMKTSDQLTKLNLGQESEAGSTKDKARADKYDDDVVRINHEIINGASYLHVHDRMLVRAPSLAVLDQSVELIRRQYTNNFATLHPAPYPGEQRQELSNLWSENDKKRGKGSYFTSTEFAGQYSLVTNGLNDPDGEYVGDMVGDMNKSAVNFAVDRFKHHVVVAMDDVVSNDVVGRAHVSSLWGSKLSQCALVNNQRVVHIVLDGTDLDRLGKPLKSLTYRLDMNNGDINMFEFFGEREDELNLFPMQLDKIALMTEQAYNTTEYDRSIIRGMLKDVLNDFYVDQKMWVRNAKLNRDKLRLVGVPHEQVPRMELFYSYVNQRREELIQNTTSQSEEQAISTLRAIYRDLLDNNGDLFNTVTSPQVDGASDGMRVIYDFGKLLQRSRGVAMAQLVNVLGFAVSSLGEGDLVIVHGVDRIDDHVELKSYMKDRFSHLHDRGGRVAYLYNDVSKAMKDVDFNGLDIADYTLLGGMRNNQVEPYREIIGQGIAPDLMGLITIRNQNLAYLHRGITNVVFRQDLALGIDPSRTPVHTVADEGDIVPEEVEASASDQPVVEQTIESTHHVARKRPRRRLAGSTRA